MPATTDWPFLLAAVLLASAALALLHHALLAGRPKGRLRCPRCFYDLAPDYRRRPVPPWRCPECGRDIARARHLRRTRRRPVLAALGLLLLLTAAATPLAPAFRRGGWPAIMPTRLLILLLPESPNRPQQWPPSIHPIERELAYRARNDRLSAADWRFALRHGNLFEHASLVPCDEPIDIVFNTPSWAETHRLQVALHADEFLSPQDPPDMTLVLRPYPRRPYEMLRHPPLRADDRELQVLVRITRPPNGLRLLLPRPTPKERLVWEGSVRLPIRVRGAPDDYRRPLDAPRISEEIAGDLDLGIVAWIMPIDGEGGGGTPVLHLASPAVVIGTGRTLTPEEIGLIERLAWGFVVELVRDGVVRARVRTVPARARPAPKGNPFRVAFDAADGLDPHPFPHALLHPDELPRWEVIVRGDPVAPLVFHDTDLHWDGLLRRPLADLLTDRDRAHLVRTAGASDRAQHPVPRSADPPAAE